VLARRLPADPWCRSMFLALCKVLFEMFGVAKNKSET